MGFKKEVTVLLEKTEEQVTSERIDNFIEDAIINCNTQIGYYDINKIPAIELEEKKLKYNLKKEEKSLKIAKYTIEDTFERYISKLNHKRHQVYIIEEQLLDLKETKSNLMIERDLYVKLLKDLTAK